VSVFIDEHRDRFGVEPICRTLGVSASAYYHRRHGELSAREVEDRRLTERIREIHQANHKAYGYRRTWKALRRAGEIAPRCHSSEFGVPPFAENNRRSALTSRASVPSLLATPGRR